MSGISVAHRIDFSHHFQKNISDTIRLKIVCQPQLGVLDSYEVGGKLQRKFLVISFEIFILPLQILTFDWLKEEQKDQFYLKFSSDDQRFVHRRCP